MRQFTERMCKPVVLFLLAVVIPLGVSWAGQAGKGPMKVFILAGQSNMEGKALASTLEALVADAETHDKFKHLTTDGKWSVREDVWVTFLDKSIRGKSDIPLYGPLSVGFGGQKTRPVGAGERIRQGRDLFGAAL